MWNTNKTIFWTIFSTLLVELVIIATLWWIFYYNYKTFATSNSGVSTKTIIKPLDERKDIAMKIAPPSINSQSQYYFWILGDLTKTVSKNANNDFKETTVQYFKLNQANIDKAIILNTLKDKKLLDLHTYQFLRAQKESEFSNELHNFLNFEILLWTISKETIDTYRSQRESEYETFLGNANTLINTGNYVELSQQLSQLDSSYQDKSMLPDVNLPQDNLINSKSIQYVLGKLLKEPKYATPIQQVAHLFSLDPELLVSAIWVEQIRYMTTARWYAKNMILENKYFTSFSQFSHGLGGVKVETARKIIFDLKTSNPSIFQAYFQQDEAKSDAEIVTKLQETFWGILYAGALLSIIEHRWESAWASL